MPKALPIACVLCGWALAAAAPAAAQSPAETAAAERPQPFFGPAPTLRSGDWSLKPRGRIQVDAGWIERPEGIALPEDRLGSGGELRRARIGVEGTMPGGLNYVFEVDLAPDVVEIVDAFIGFRASSQLGLTLGQHNNFQSLDELTSSRFTSFIERAAFTDAFGFERRLGLSATYSEGPLLVQGGVFQDNLLDIDEDGNNSRSVDGRIVYAPKRGETQLHFGISAHHRSNGDLDDRGATTRYRQRPLVHFTDTRFISTPALRVSSETDYGLEAAVIAGPFHAAAEAHWLNAETPAAEPTFFGGYAEAGFYLTGESRGYRGGRFDRTRVRRPVGGGGIGAVQLNLRYDRLDLNSAGISGGTQDGYLASLIWIPQDHLRFLLNAGRLEHRDARIAAAGGDRDYGVTVFGVRAQVDW
jgi:phosphate-selective porin OprO/OprP